VTFTIASRGSSIVGPVTRVVPSGSEGRFSPRWRATALRPLPFFLPVSRTVGRSNISAECGGAPTPSLRHPVPLRLSSGDRVPLSRCAHIPLRVSRTPHGDSCAGSFSTWAAFLAFFRFCVVSRCPLDRLRGSNHRFSFTLLASSLVRSVARVSGIGSEAKSANVALNPTASVSGNCFSSSGARREGRMGASQDSPILSRQPDIRALVQGTDQKNCARGKYSTRLCVPICTGRGGREGLGQPMARSGGALIQAWICLKPKARS
jgi:hypothetical protein